MLQPRNSLPQTVCLLPRQRCQIPQVRAPTGGRWKNAKQEHANGAKSKGPRARPIAFPTNPADEDRHQLASLARLVCIPGESHERFVGMGLEIRGELNPSTEIERMLATKILLAFWRQTRAWSLERASIQRASASVDSTVTAYTEVAALALESFGSTGRSAIGEYEARFDRQFTRALAAFHRYRKNHEESSFAHRT